MPLPQKIDATAKAQEIRQLFAPDSPLARRLVPYEIREGQIQLAEAVAQALQSRQNLIAEAGTGIGKTLAYLLAALHCDLKVVISTGTKNLQDQLVYKDLPVALAAVGRRVSVEVMKGRGNYLCEVRAATAFSQGILPNTPGAQQLRQLQLWAHKTDTGERHELTHLADDSPLWKQVSATREQCLGRHCPQYDRCWVTQMRRRAQVADVLVVNHHLLIADYVLRERLAEDGFSLIPYHDAIIFDEAHDLDDIAAQHFGFHVSEGRFDELLHDVRTGLDDHGQIRQHLSAVLERSGQLKAELFDALPFDSGRARLRPEALAHSVAEGQRDLDGLLHEVQSTLATIDSDEARALGRRAESLATELAFVLGIPQGNTQVEDTTNDATFVRFCETSARQRALVARPVDVIPMLGRMLKQTPAVFMSATLRVGKTFDHFRRRMGLDPCKELHVPSPFAYDAQACLYLPTDLPDPESPGYAFAAAQRAAQLVQAAGGGAFVLCTSHRALSVMRDALENTGVRPLLMQGEAPKTQLVEVFRRHGNAALIATMSFWKGVDVIGPALRLVIIDKLPFASPTDPVVAARLELLTHLGHDPFMAYQVPQAALLLRQGFGRLIRRQTDQGMVAILDPRLRTRRYGPLLLRNLPPCRRIAHTDEALEQLRQLCLQGTLTVRCAAQESEECS